MDEIKVKYKYFKPTGKWKYEGYGLPIPAGHVDKLTHDYLYDLNGGCMPGITTNGKDMIVVVDDDTSWPRLIREVE